MNQAEAASIIQKANYFSQVFEGIDGKILSWVDNNEKLYRYFVNQIKHYKKIIDKFPEERITACSNQFVAGKVLGDPVMLRKFLYNNKNELNSEEKDIIQYFIEHPWFYAFFTIKECLPNNILIAENCSDNQEFLLYSTGVSSLYKAGKSLFFCLLYANEESYQTYGLIHYYCGFTMGDIESFAYEASHHYKNSHKLSESIFHNSVEYMLLDNYAEIPPSLYKGEPIFFCTHTEHADTFDLSGYKEYFNIQEKQNIIKASMKKYKDTKLSSDIYYDKKKQSLLLHTTSLDRYQELIGIFAGKYSFPNRPVWYTSVLMSIAIEQILSKRNPSFQYERIFNDTKSSGSDKSLEPLNALMRDLTNCRNNGIHYSIVELAQKYDVPMDTARQLENMLTEMNKKFEIDIEGGFEDFISPPPAERDKFREAPNQNSLFILNSEVKEDIEKLNHGIESLMDFITLLDDLYYKSWNRRDYTILMYTFYLLHKKGTMFQKVDDYAVECLKTFWQVLIPRNSATDIYSFIRKYRKFCFDVLQHLGLVINEDQILSDNDFFSDYKIKVTSLFRKLFQFKK